VNRDRRKRFFDDPEVLKLLRDEPELLAIADAISQTQPHREARRPRVSVLAAALLGAVLVAVSAVAFWPSEHGGLIDRALAAVSAGPVLHARSERTLPNDVVVDLASGQETPTRIEIETWFDQQARELRSRVWRNGVRIADALQQEASAAGPDADRAVVLFARGYRSALESGHARVVSSGGGASAPRITVDVSPDMTEVVSIDRETHKPRTFAVPTAAGKETWQVLSVASRARQRTDFLPEARRPAFVRGSVRSQKEIAGAQVRSSGLAWPGPRFDGYALVRAFADRLVAEGGAAGRRAGRGLRLAYRSPRHSQPLTIQVSRRAEPAYGFAEGRLTVSFNPLPRLGKIAIVRVGAPPGERWVGQLEHAGSFVTIRSHSKASVIGAARAISGNA